MDCGFRVTRAFWLVPKPRLQKKDLGWGFQLLSQVEVTEVSPTVQLEVQTLLFPGKELERCVGRCERAEKNNQREMLTPSRKQTKDYKGGPCIQAHKKKKQKTNYSPSPLAGKRRNQRERQSAWEEDAKEPDILGRRQSVGASPCVNRICGL